MRTIMNSSTVNRKWKIKLHKASAKCEELYEEFGSAGYLLAADLFLEFQYLEGVAFTDLKDACWKAISEEMKALWKRNPQWTGLFLEEAYMDLYHSTASKRLALRVRELLTEPEEIFQVNIIDTVDGEHFGTISKWSSDGYTGRTISTEYSDGYDYTYWNVFHGTRKECEEYIKTHNL